jgi:phage head maturation protease
MPLNRCQDDDKPGWKWGDAGKCYTYTAGNEESETAARKKALAQAAAMGEFPGTGQRGGEFEILERRDAAVLADSVDFPQRIVDVIAVPYEQEAEIVWRGETWREVFSRSAFDGIEDHAGRVPVNREHHIGDTVGKIVKLDPRDPRGLLASVKIARTLRGDDTLQLASEGMLGASVGYFVKKGSDVDTNRRIMMRRVNRAFLQHLAMVESPAYVGAETVAVREGLLTPPAAGEPLVTPSLDEVLADDVFTWAKHRVSGN